MIAFAQTKIPRSARILVLVALLFSGCGEFAYKRGANSSELETVKIACGENGPGSAAVEKCMAESGWVVHNLNRMEPLDADPVVDASVISSTHRIETAAGAMPGKQGSEGYVSAVPSAEKQHYREKKS